MTPEQKARLRYLQEQQRQKAQQESRERALRECLSVVPFVRLTGFLSEDEAGISLSPGWEWLRGVDTPFTSEMPNDSGSGERAQWLNEIQAQLGNRSAYLLSCGGIASR